VRKSLQVLLWRRRGLFCGAEINALSSDRTLTVFHGCPEMPRLSHYFLPRLLFAKEQILYLDGANQISPLLLARFARERGVDPSTVNSLIRVARAFTCFQLTELVVCPGLWRDFLPTCSSSRPCRTCTPMRMFATRKRALHLNVRSRAWVTSRRSLFRLPSFRRHIIQDQAAGFLSATSQPGRTRRQGGIHSRQQAFLYPREKYFAASGLNGKIEVHYGENRPYFRPIDSRGRGALEKVSAHIAAGRPTAFRPALPCSTLTPSTRTRKPILQRQGCMKLLM